MGIRANMTADLANSVRGAVNSAASLAQVAGKSISDKKSQQRLEAVQWSALPKSYTAKLSEYFKSLPTDFTRDDYVQRIESVNASWYSDLESSGMYSDKMLTRIREEFLPSQTGKAENAAAGVNDFAKDTLTATLANTQAQLWAADKNMSYEMASKAYASYFNDNDLSSIAIEHGILDPQAFNYAIRSAKVVQSVLKTADTEYGFSASFDSKALMDKAIASIPDYNPTSSERLLIIQELKTGLSDIMKSYKSDAEERVNAFKADYAEKSKEELVYYPLDDIDAAINNYPPETVSGFLEFRKTIVKSNDVVIANAIYSGDTELSDENLEMIENPTIKKNLMASKLYNLGITAYNETGDKEKALLKITSSKDLSFTPTPEAISKARTKLNGVIVASSGSSKSLKTSSSKTVKDQLPGILSDGTEGYSDSESLKRLKNARSEGLQPIALDTMASSLYKNGLITKEDAQRYGSSLFVNDSNTVSPDMEDFRKSGTLIDMTTGYSNLEALSDLRSQQLNGAAKAFLEQLASFYYFEGKLTKEDSEKYSKELSFVNNDNWDLLMTTLGLKATFFYPKDAVGQKNFTQRMTNFFVNKCIEDPNLVYNKVKWSDMIDSLNVLSSEEVAEKLIRDAVRFSKISEGSESYFKTLSKDTNIMQLIKNGEIDSFIDKTMQALYFQQTGTAGEGTTEFKKDFFADIFTNRSYEQLKEENLILAYIVDLNIAFASAQSEVIELFKDSFEGSLFEKGEYGEIKIQWTGDNWAIGDPVNKELWYSLDFDAIGNGDKEAFAGWRYFTVPLINGEPQFASRSSLMPVGSLVVGLMNRIEKTQHEIKENEKTIERETPELDSMNKKMAEDYKNYSGSGGMAVTPDLQKAVAVSSKVRNATKALNELKDKQSSDEQIRDAQKKAFSYIRNNTKWSR